MGEYIYLIRKAEFKLVDTNIYKIGKTKRNIEIRLSEYYGDKDVYLTEEVNDCTKCEKELIDLLSKEFEKVALGREYFKGNIDDIKKTVEDYLKKEENRLKKENFLKKENYSKKKNYSKKQEKTTLTNIVLQLEPIKKVEKLESKKKQEDYVCDRCGVSFKQKKHLIQHLTRRDECLEIFSDKPRDAIISSLKEKKGIPCDKCNKTYSSKYYLEKHKCSKLEQKEKEPYNYLIKKIEVLEEKVKQIEHQSIQDK